MNYIVSYDISSDKNRKNLSNFLIENGLERIQLSVFHGNFSLRKLDFIVEGSKKFFKHSTDSLVFIPLCSEDLKKHIFVGYGKRVKIDKMEEVRML